MAKQTLILQVQEICTDTTAQRLTLPTFDYRGMVCVDRLTAVVENTPPTYVEFGILSGSREYVLARVVPTATVLSMSMRGKVWHTTAMRPYAKFVGATSGETLDFFFYGYVTTGPME